MWRDCNYKAVALFPYSSTEKYHLSIIQYDILEVSKECGEWVFARCVQTGCLGICPKNYIGEYKDEIDIVNRKLYLEFAALTQEVFQNYLIPAKDDDPYACRILDILMKIQRTYPVVDDMSRSLVTKYIEELREFLHFPVLERNATGTLLKTHEITSISKKVEKKLHSEYQSTYVLTFAVHADPQPTPFHIRLFLYNTSTKTNLTLSKECIFNQDRPVDSFICPDIDPKIVNNLALVAVISDYFETETGYYNEVKGCSVEVLSTADRPFKLGHDSNCTLKFFSSKDSSNTTLYRDILENKQGLTPTIDIPTVSVSFSSYEHNNEATTPFRTRDLGISKLGSFKYPINVGTNYNTNKLYVKLAHLRHKTKIKPTRILIRAVDLSSKMDGFIPCFPYEKDPTCAVTAIQRGSMDMDIDEIVEVELDPKNFPNPDFSFIIFLVERSYRPPQESYISSFCFVPLFDLKKGCMYEFQTPKRLKLIKPPKQPDYHTLCAEIANFHSFEECFSEPGDPGFIDIETSLISTTFTKVPDVYKLLTTTPDKDATFDEIQIYDVQYYYPWGPKILFELSKIICENGRNSSRALSAFISTLKALDQAASRDPFLERVLNSFISDYFVSENSFLAKLGQALFQYTAKVLESSNADDPQTANSMANIQRALASILRIIVESVNFAKMNEQAVDEQQVRKDFKAVFDSTCKRISSTEKMAVVQRQFLIRALPHFLQLMNYYFSKKEVIDFALIAFSSTPAAANDKLKVFDHFANSEIFRNEEIRRGLLPEIVKEVIKDDYKSCVVEKVLPLGVTIFFDMLGSSSSFAGAIQQLAPLFSMMIGQPEYSTALILFIYYSMTLGVKQIMTYGGNPAKTFSDITEMLLKAVDDASPAILFGLVPAFVKVFLLSQDDNFSETRKDVILLIKTISSFYRQFLHRLEIFTPLDRAIYSQMFAIDLTPISHLLPLLIENVPKDYHFDSSIFIPLFHMYISSKDTGVRQVIMKALGQIFTAEGKKMQAIEAPIVDALIAVMSVEGMAEIVSIFDIITEISPTAKQSVAKLIQFSQNLANLSLYPPNASYEDERVASITFLLEGFRNSESAMINFPHFAIMLYELHISLNNQVEAAEVLTFIYNFLADKKQDDECRPESIFPAQTVFARRCALMKRAYELYMQAQFFEHAVECTTELRNLLEPKYDYAGLVEVCELESRAWKEITTIERTQLNRFYGAKFFGDCFDEIHRNKTFIYRRGGYFDNGQMLAFMKQKFPNAECSPRPPPDNADFSKGYVYIFNVKPLVEDSYCPEESPAGVMTRTVCRIQKFYSEVPVRVKIEGKKYNEIAEYHRHITEYEVQYPLEGIVRRAVVVKSSGPRVMSPVECAVVDTNAKSLELLQKASSYWRCLTYDVPFDKSAVSAFSMLINGIVNAAVNGGTKLFQELFLEGDLARLPEQLKWAPKLKEAFVTQLKAVNFAISVHNYVVADDFRPLHNQIVEQFVEMQKSMESQVGSVDFSVTTTNLGKIPQAMPPKE